MPNMLNETKLPSTGSFATKEKNCTIRCTMGHKRGRGNPELVELLGEKCVGIDVNL